MRGEGDSKGHADRMEGEKMPRLSTHPLDGFREWCLPGYWSQRRYGASFFL